MSINLRFLLFCLTTLILSETHAQCGSHEVNIVGQMKDVMWKGQLYGKIHLDTLPDKTHLYGMGPVEGLTGEILINNGRAWKSTVVSENHMKVEETYDLRAPFFAYARIEKWQEMILPDSIRTMINLENHLLHLVPDCPGPFMFKLMGKVETATIHIVNLPPGSKVSSPEDAHRGKISYHLREAESEIVGFFSTRHQGVFTHKNTFLHMHLITADQKKMGHLDEVAFKKGGIKLYLPQYRD